MSTQSQRALRLEGILAETAERVKSLWAYADAHREATLADLEGQTEQRSQGLLAGAMEEVLAEKGSVSVGDCCPQCGVRMHYKGKQRRRQETLAGVVCWERGYYYCGHCRQGHYPVDELLQVPGGQFGPGVQEASSRLAAELPFARAAEALQALKGVRVSSREVGRIAEQRGAALGKQQGLQEESRVQGEQPLGRQELPLEGKRGMALDAVMAHFRDGWHEVKVGVTFQTSPQGDGPESTVRAVGQHYRGHIGSMEQMGQQLYAEALRQGYCAERETVVCLADGARSNWEQFAQHFASRVEILDWYHATQHLWAAGNGLYGEKSTAAQAWVEAREGELWAGNVAAVLQALQEAAQGPRGEAPRAEIHYFSSNQERMHYDRYRAQQYPIGSGVVESACKQLVTWRLGAAGMRWSQPGAQAILNLRAALLSHDWQQAWSLTQPPPNSPKS
jgi:hypothetical protein